MSKRCIYIAGPISKGDLVHNVKQSDEAFKKLVQAGFAPLNPMWSCFSGSVQRDWLDGPVYARGTPTGGLGLTHDEWLGTDLPWVEKADALLRLPGESKGADMEVAHAKATGVPVFTDMDVLIRAMNVTHVVESVDNVWPVAVGERSLSIDSMGGGMAPWPVFQVGDTVRFLSPGNPETHVVEDKYEGQMRLVPQFMLDASVTVEQKTYEGFRAWAGDPATGYVVEHTQIVRVYLTKRIA